MRVLIMSDMEGVAGVVKWAQVTGGDSAAYQQARELYTGEINAAIRGARSAGADQVIVMDCHGAGNGWSLNSLIQEQLEPDCEFAVQEYWTEYVEPLEQGTDAALFVGMHAMAGTPRGVLSHTVSGSHWHNLWFNDRLHGETGINAALCGNWGCPVVMVTGDRQTCAEATDLLGDGLTTVAVKDGIGRYSARHLTPIRAREAIEAGALKALSDLKAVAPYDPGRPCEITVEFSHADGTEKYAYRHGVEVLDGRRIKSTASDWWTAWRQFYF
jgi:D-amino peptidase